MIQQQVLPAAPTGAPLFPAREPWAVIVPEATVNLVPNPSVERDAAGYAAGTPLGAGGTLLRQATRQRRGVWALSAVGGVQRDCTLVASRTYTFSADVLGLAGRMYELAIWESAGSGTMLAATRFRATGFWQRVAVSATAVNAGSHKIWVAHESYAGNNFLTDGWQLEEKPYPTTYCDGDVRGFGRDATAYLWLGAPHGSASMRSAHTATGGREMSFERFGWLTLAVLGFGLVAVANVATAQALRGGAAYQHSMAQVREVSVAGAVTAPTQAELERRLAALARALAPERTAQPQPLVLRYQGWDAAGRVPTGETVEIAASYRGGLEGATDNPTQARASLDFQVWLPVLLAEGEAGATLGTNVSPTINFIARRDATGRWSNLSGGTNGRVQALLARHSDNYLYAAGVFTTAGGVTVNGVARWRDGAWSAMGSGLAGASAQGGALAEGPGGSVYVGGIFSSAGGTPANNVALWDGNAWSALGSGVSGGTGMVWALVVAPDGKVYAGGEFTAPGSRAARWDGSAWAALGSGLNGTVLCMAFGPDGWLYAGGSFTTAGGVAANFIARWKDGVGWQALGSGLSDFPSSMAFGLDGNLYVTGAFETAGGVTVNRVARWNGVGWQALGSGLGDGLLAGAGAGLAVGTDGLLYAVGSFNSAGGLALNSGMARWNGSAWLPMDLDLIASGVGGDRIALGADGSLVMAISDGGVTSDAAEVVTVVNAGSAVAAPRVRFVGPGRVVQLVNSTTGQGIYFDLTLLAGEEATLDLDPDRLSFNSTLRGNILGSILPGSQLTTWRLRPGANDVSVLLTSTTSASAAEMLWRVGYVSLGGATR